MSYYSQIINENHNIDLDDGINLYLIDGSLNSVEIVLPDCSSFDGIYIVIYCKNKNYQCKISCYDTQLIDNIGSNIIFSNLGEKYNFVSFESKWYVI